MKIKAQIGQGKLALITGGSSGIGFALADNLVRQGNDVILVARRKELLDKSVTELRTKLQTPGQKVEGIQADVADWEQVEALAMEVTNGGAIPDLLINCAGVVQPGYVQDLDVERFHWMMDINYYGTVHVVKAFLPEMMKRKSGYLINISSAAGYYGVFGYTGYSASKFAVRGFSDTLRWEMAPHKIGVSLVYPADTDTPQLAYDNKHKPIETKTITENGGTMTADEVAKEIIKAATRGKYLIVPGIQNKVLYFFSNHFGGKVLDWLAQVALSLVAKAKVKKSSQ